MSFWSRLFGGGSSNSAPTAPAEIHDGFAIHAEPINEGGRWRIAARIEKNIEGVTKSHKMVRADTLESADTAAEASVAKAKMLIDEQGDKIFD